MDALKSAGTPHLDTSKIPEPAKLATKPLPKEPPTMVQPTAVYLPPTPQDYVSPSTEYTVHLPPQGQYSLYTQYANPMHFQPAMHVTNVVYAPTSPQMPVQSQYGLTQSLHMYQPVSPIVVQK